MSDLSRKALARLEERLRGRTVGRRTLRVASCASTQDLVGEQAEGGAAEGLVVVAERQTRGRGRQGSRWVQRPGKDLAFSVLLRPPAGLRPILPAALLPAAVCLGLEAGLGVDLALKWPNDVLHQGRKLAGVLMEASSAGGGGQVLALGVGVNGNSSRFPADLGGGATSARNLLGRHVDRAELLRALLEALDEAWREILAGRTHRLLEALRRRLDLVGREVTLVRGGQPLRVVVEAMDLDGFTVRAPGDARGRVPLEVVARVLP